MWNSKAVQANTPAFIAMNPVVQSNLKKGVDWTILNLPTHSFADARVIVIVIIVIVIVIVILIHSLTDYTRIIPSLIHSQAMSAFSTVDCCIVACKTNQTNVVYCFTFL